MGKVKSTSDKLPGWITDITKEESRQNFTDVKVIHDPIINKPISGRDYNGADSPRLNSNVQTVQVHGILVPIIDINGRAISVDNLVDMVLSFTDFTPTLEVTIEDINRNFQYIGGLGLNNRISVILVPSESGVYRKLSVPFYIKEQQNLEDNKIKFICEYFHSGLWKTACEQIGDKQLTTYEFCEEISKMLQLGFAATDKCKDIDDKRWRQIYSQRISEFIKEQISIGGIDEESVFDAWIDPYGYLNLVNLSWIYNEKVMPEELVMVSMAKTLQPTDIDNGEAPKTKTKRFITNMNNIPLTENIIKEQYNNLCTETTMSKGTFRNCWIMKDAGNTNTIELQNIQMIESSVEGVEASSFYEFHTTEFLGVEMSEDTPYLYQKEICSSFLSKHRSRQITIILNAPNYAFQRGQLLNVLYIENDPQLMKKVVSRADALTAKTFDKDSVTEPSVETANDALEKSKSNVQINFSSLMNEDSFALNPALSGIYYIDGIEYIYSEETQSMTQYMYLIKKGIQSNLENPFTGPRI